ncbi:MAG: glycosyltransferase family 39 protein [Chloroflexi bacterium]|nr:glycosyltransferase family 39 protein [Chloroflexota bacterium]
MNWRAKAYTYRGRIGWLLLLLLDTAVFTFITRQIITFQQYPFDSDEASHTLGGLDMALALRAGAVSEFVAAFGRQNFYPPGVAWLKALAFIAFGDTILVARLFSAVCFFLAVLLVYAIGQQIDRQYGWLSGLIAAGLTLTMQSLLITSALVMLEAPGLLVSLLLLWVYLRALARPSRGRLILVSFLLALTILTKYTYGAVALGAVGLMELSLCRPSTSAIQSQIKERWLWLFGPLALVMLLWIANPLTLAGVFDYAQPLPSNEPWLSLDGLQFYPLSLALHDVPAPLFALVSVAGLAWAVVHWRNPGIRLLLLYFLLGMGLIMLVNHPHNYRFIAPFVPALHLLTAVMLTNLLDIAKNRWDETGKGGRTAVVMVTILLLLAGLQSIVVLSDRFRQYPSVMEVEIETDPALNKMAIWLQMQIPPGSRFFMLNYWDQFSPEAIAWRLGQQAVPIPEATMPAAVLTAASPATLQTLQQSLAAQQTEYVVVLEGGPWGTAAWPEYTQIIETDYDEMSRNQFTIPLYSVGDWLDTHLLTMPAWEEVKADGRTELHIQAIVYRRAN